MKDILGGKGANLAEMTAIGIPVPPGFTISAKLCGRYLAERRLSEGLRTEVTQAMRRLEEVSGRTFGDVAAPLLVSVRSGAAVSMPGMMDTILNLGLNEETVKALARQSGNERFAYDAYRRFIQMYGDVVFGLKAPSGEHDPFERALDTAKRQRKVRRDVDLEAKDLKALAAKFRAIVERATGHSFPTNPWDQLWGAIEAVFRSWQTKRASDYRRVHRIPDDLGTAVSVVAMVYGNLGDDSGTGVAFTRNPSTGERKLFGEFLVNAQGEDVVAGIRDPEPIADMARRLPAAFGELQRTCDRLERHFRDLQDVEFTVERGRLFLLQTRAAKRTALAAVRAAVEMVDEGLLDRREAVRRVQPDQLDQLLHPTIDPGAEIQLLATGLPASPGAAVGKAVFDADRAETLGNKGEPVI
ncbi:MAG: pyruvate, phosphate dikinase, partial [Gemmatimonadetes bacterium]|nr:pyruvate, phosphate dikinase [Gemmatimonadota bacterium]